MTDDGTSSELPNRPCFYSKKYLLNLFWKEICHLHRISNELYIPYIHTYPFMTWTELYIPYIHTPSWHMNWAIYIPHIQHIAKPLVLYPVSLIAHLLRSKRARPHRYWAPPPMGLLAGGGGSASREPAQARCDTAFLPPWTHAVCLQTASAGRNERSHLQFLCAISMTF